MKRKVFLAWQSQNRDTEKYVSNQLDAAKKDRNLHLQFASFRPMRLLQICHLCQKQAVQIQT